MKEHIIINKDRTVVVPDSVRKIGIQYDHKVNTLTFDCPRYADDNQSIDMSRMAIYINFSRNDKTKGSIAATNVFVDPDDPEIMHFDFVITRSVTLVNGPIICLVCAKSTDAEGVEVNHWNSELFNKLSVGEGMEAEEELTEEEIDYITSLLQEINTTRAEVADMDTRVEDLEFSQEKQGAVSEVDLGAMTWTEGSYITGSGTIGSSSGYGISELVTLPKMSTLILDATGYQSDVAMIAKTDHTPLVTSDGKTHYEYYTDEEIQVYISCKTTEAKSAKIIRNVAETLSDLERENSELKSDLTNYDKSVNNYNLLDDAQFFNDKQFIETGGYFWDNDYWDSYKITNNLTNKIVAKKDNKSIFHMTVGYFNGDNYISGKSYSSNTDKYELNLPEGCNIICVSFNVHDDDLEGLMFNCVTDIGEAVKENSKNIDELRNRTSNFLTTNELILDNEFYELPKIEDYENKYAYSLSDGKPKWESEAFYRTCSIDGNINIKAYFTNAVDGFNVSIYLVTVTKCENEVYSTKTFNVNDLFLYNTSKEGTVYGISYEIDVEKRAIQFIGNTNNVTLSITMAENSGYVEYIKRYRPKWLISKPNEIYVCANDSTDEEKEYADYLCDGVNDEVEIMNAIKKLNPFGVVVLSSGTFNIQSFSRYREEDVKCAIFSDKEITIQGSGMSRTKLFVSNDTLSALTEKVAIVSGYDTFINLNDLSFELANHNHPCICYYGANLSRGNITNVSAKASENDNTATIDIPNENCIAFVSYHGDDYGTMTIWESVVAIGFYRGFQLGAEHHILKQCSGRFNYCTFTFGEYEVKLGNAFSHPITLINCADEHQCLLPQFYKCGAMVNEDTEGHPLQEVDFISFNIERWNDWSEHQMCAKEVNAGDFCGRIEYTMNGVTPSGYEEWTATKNLKHAKFWENGSGVNFITRNMTHRLGGTTELRNTYYPNYMQEYYDTDLKKKLIYDGINWVDLNGTVIN